jgi:HD-like signal output (HDOD) protein
MLSLPAFFERFFRFLFPAEENPPREPDRAETVNPAGKETLKDVKIVRFDAPVIKKADVPADHHQKQFVMTGEEEKQRWWCFEGHPPPTDIPVFEILQDDRVVEELNRKIDEDEFPVIEIPNNVMKAMQILNNPNFDYNDVGSLIKRSPAMVGEFFKIANSSMFNCGAAITDIKMALPRLGKNNIKSILYMYSSKMSFTKAPLFNDIAVSIVDHCYTVGLVAGYLSQRYFSDPDEAFLAGLLHDVGKLGIFKALSETYELPEDMDFKTGEELFDSIFPALHEKSGKYLALNWKIDPIIISAIEHHHDFMEAPDFDKDSEEFKLSALISLSDSVTRILGKGRRIGKVNIFDLPAAKELDLIKDHDTVKFLDDVPKMVSFQYASDAPPGEQPNPAAKKSQRIKKH